MNTDMLAFIAPLAIEKKSFPVNSIGYSTEFYMEENNMPKLKDANIAIVGIPESRAAVNNESNNAPDVIRQHFYSLYNHFENVKIVDIGNVKVGKSVNDTYAAAKMVIATLLKHNIFVIILGGSNDLVYANYLAYESKKQLINLTCIDQQFDLGVGNDVINSQSYLSNIIVRNPNYLFNFTNIGFQSYFVDKEAIKLMDSLYFEAYRLGLVRSDIAEVEPAIRNSDIVSLDISAVKSSDAPANAFASPNGFTGDEICVLSRYAGCSDKISSFGIYEYNPALDTEFKTAKLIAQILWYLIDGYAVRTGELPYSDSNKFIKYHVNSSVFKNEVVFYKSKQTDRWWMEVECPEKLKSRYSPNYLISCSYKDYLAASNNEIPERWIQAYKKLME